MKFEFKASEPFSVGVEEELFLVDTASLRLSGTAQTLVPAMGLPERHVSTEAYSSEIELRSSPCASASEATFELQELRRAASEAGGTLIGAGLHPAGSLGDVGLVESKRYRTVAAEMRGLIARTPESALHVHIGMPDAETAIRVHNGLRSWLPLLVALSASSPFWFGRDSGLASARRASVAPYPGRGVPDPLVGPADYEKRLAEVSSAGGPSDYTLLWWDVRLHPRLGTVEVREMDSQSRLDDVAAIAALIRGLACHEASASSDPLPREMLEWSMFRAMRDGVGAELTSDGSLAPVRKLSELALGLAAPHAAEVGDTEALEGIERILVEPSPDRQRAAFARGGITAVLALLRRETAAPLRRSRFNE